MWSEMVYSIFLAQVERISRGIYYILHSESFQVVKMSGGLNFVELELVFFIYINSL